MCRVILALSVQYTQKVKATLYTTVLYLDKIKQNKNNRIQLKKK